jgi:hypothetical protein
MKNRRFDLGEVTGAGLSPCRLRPAPCHRYKKEPLLRHLNLTLSTLNLRHNTLADIFSATYVSVVLKFDNILD